MTAVGVSPAAGRPGWASRPGLRLACLHWISRRGPAALAALAACAIALWAVLHWRLGGGNGIATQSMLVVIEAGVASVITVATRSPIGESERTGGRWLPYLRLGTAVALTAAAVGLLAVAAAAGGGMSGGSLALLRNVAGLVGIGFLTATVTGGGLAWTGPVAYLMLSEVAIHGSWTTPLIWAARPPHDRGAAMCAALVFAAGIAATALFGARDSARDYR
jgi:hypothetical protein